MRNQLWTDNLVVLIHFREEEPVQPYWVLDRLEGVKEQGAVEVEVLRYDPSEATSVCTPACLPDMTEAEVCTEIQSTSFQRRDAAVLQERGGKMRALAGIWGRWWRY